MSSSDIVFAVVFTALVILGLLISIVVIMLIASRMRTRQEAALTRTRLDYEKELRSIAAEVQEATLTHISAELHDNIGQLLTLMKLQLEKEKLLHPAISPVFVPLTDTLQQALQQVRLLSHSLNHDFILEHGLQKLIGNEVQRLQNLGTHGIHFTTDEVEPLLENDQRLVIFRIFQELQTNILRHALADHIFITLQGRDGFRLIVRDDGKGFDRTAIPGPAGGLGLKNMFKRASLAGLHFSVRSAVQEGTSCTLTNIETITPLNT